MSNQTIQIIIMLVVLIGVLGTLIGLLPYLKSKGVNVSAILDNAQKATDSIDKAIALAQDVLPNNSAVGLLSIIEKWTKIAVGNAEQLNHAGDITEDERATVAETTVLNVLKELNITIDDNKKALIDAAIKDAVNNLGHTKTAVIKQTTPVETVNTVVITPKIVYKAPDGTELAPVQPTLVADTNTPTADTTTAQGNIAPTDGTQPIAQ